MAVSKVEKQKRSTTQATLAGFFTPAPVTAQKRKRPLHPSAIVVAPKFATAKTTEIQTLTQTQLTHLPLLHTCSTCQMSYVRGSDDEGLHVKHHARVVRGIPWDSKGKGWKVVDEDIRFGAKREARGRIIMVDGVAGGSRVSHLLSIA